MSQRRRRARSAPGRGRNTNFSTTQNIALMSPESQDSFRDTTDVESTGRQSQNARNDLIILPPAGAAFPAPPRIAKKSIERRETDVEIETEIVPPVPKRRQSKTSAVSSISSLANAPENDLKQVPKLQLEGVVFNSSPRAANNESCSKPASPKMETAMPGAINDVLGEFKEKLDEMRETINDVKEEDEPGTARKLLESARSTGRKVIDKIAEALTSDKGDDKHQEQPHKEPEQDEITEEEEEIQSPVFEPIEYGKSKVFFEEWHSRQTIEEKTRPKTSKGAKKARLGCGVCYLSKSETDLNVWDHEADVKYEEESKTQRIQLRPKNANRDAMLEIFKDVKMLMNEVERLDEQINGEAKARAELEDKCKNLFV